MRLFLLPLVLVQRALLSSCLTVVISSAFSPQQQQRGRDHHSVIRRGRTPISGSGIPATSNSCFRHHGDPFRTHPSLYGSNNNRLNHQWMALRASSSKNDDKDGNDGTFGLADVGGVFASLIVLYSEYTLKTTGCGLPAGPFGLYGAVEGISYLAVVGIVGYSIFEKLQGQDRSSSSIQPVVQGFAVLAIVVGLAVLAFQIADYGYIPNAVPMEGGMCQ